MKLSGLLEGILPYKLITAEDITKININQIQYNSNHVQPGDLFVCLRGIKTDGHHFAKQAVEKGAAAVLAEEPLDLNVPLVLVPDSRRALAFLAAGLYDYPSEEISVIGVTGTNGKTTVTHLIEAILEHQQLPTGIIGTVGIKVTKDQQLPTTNTTPESLDIQHALAEMRKAELKHCAMEVSSHALDMGRLRGINIRKAVFTNLTQDHLDYHHTMEAYKHAKMRLFEQLGYGSKQQQKYAIINLDDPVAADFIKASPTQVITYAIDNEKADIIAKNVQMTSQGTSFRVECFSGKEDFSVKLLGRFNVYNCLAAIAVGLTERIKLTDMREALAGVNGVAGRMEMVHEGQEFTIVVDYAHTPDSLENVLKTIQSLAQGNIYCLIGCGGDRDRSKRPIMANVATTYAHVAVFTSDNPRSEDPEVILDDMMSGLIEQKTSSQVMRIVDRKEAIEWCIKHAQKNDIVLIAGKGHETYQILKDRTIQFDDAEVARKALRSRKGGE